MHHSYQLVLCLVHENTQYFERVVVEAIAA